jgi:sodium-dependent dicarboxylate transporter 2/3/5
MNYLKKYGVQLLGPLLFIIVLTIPTSLNSNQQQFMAIFTFVVFNWLFSSIPLFVTGFFGVTLSIVLNLAPAAKIFSNFGHPIVFLFLGGFLLAKAFNNVGLDRRISLYLLTRKFINGSIKRLIFTLMALTAGFTMWISNTATTAMMLPLVLGILTSLKITCKKTISLILICIAYSSSIGGIATPIGSTPNIIGIGMLQELVHLKVSFLEWMAYCFPLALLFLGILFVFTNFQLRKEMVEFNNDFLLDEFKKLPSPSRHEFFTLAIFLMTVVLWLLPSLFKLAGLTLPLNLNPGAVAIFSSSLLFIFPLGKKNKILITKDIKNIDWSSLLLFGSGLALGKLLFDLGLAAMAGNILISFIQDFGIFGMFLTIFTFVIFSTELTSNTASANILLPIMISLAQQLDMNPLFLTMGVSIACSLAFMLPVATPPNAIVYGSEKVNKNHMIKMGLGLNLCFSLTLAIVIYFYNK